jgi:RluA family pseudouridine synthase
MQILFEDEDIIVVNKPSGLPSQGTPDPKRSHVLSELEKLKPGMKFYLHHRLDKDTSGVLLLGKSKRANAPLTNIFREHQIEKTYNALSLTKNKANIETKFDVKDHLAPVRGQGKKLMRMVKVKSGGWLAETHFKVLELFESFALIEAKPITGRTHQIRVHLAGLKLPIAGDFLYGGKCPEVPRLLLHAAELKLKHPISGSELNFKAELPKDFQSVLTRLSEKRI